MRHSRLVHIAVLSLSAGPIIAGELGGTVLDPGDSVVPGAVVTAHCGSRSAVVKTNKQGHFVFTGLPSAVSCRLEVTRPGFSPYREEVNSGDRELIARLTLAPLAQSLTVEGNPEVLVAPSFGSVSLSADQLSRISNSTPDLIRYAKLLAGAPPDRDAVYVDGMPASSLPPVERIARIVVNPDAFSAEYSDGDFTHIDIITKAADRKVHYGFGGISLGAGGRNPLDRELRNTSTGGNGYFSAPIPYLPVTFSLRGSFTSNVQREPLLAVVPRIPQFYEWRKSTSVDVASRSSSGEMEIDYSPGERFRAHFVHAESRSGGSNLGSGGIVLPEAGLRTSSINRDTRIGISEMTSQLTYQGGLSVTQTGSESRANSDAEAIFVLGGFVSGGAQMTSSDTRRIAWNLKNVLRSPGAGPSWDVGFTLSGSHEIGHVLPNRLGYLEFTDAEGYLDALAGKPAGTWHVIRGNGTTGYTGMSASPFVQRQLFRSDRFVMTGGLRTDYQSGLGVLVSPRLSTALNWHGFVFRAGSGLFVHNIPANVFIRALQNDGSHLQEFVRFASLEPQALTATIHIHSQLQAGLTQSREFLMKHSTERTFRNFSPGFEYTWARERHMLGSRRLDDRGSWLDLIESNRSAERHRLHTRLGYRLKRGTITAHYEWMHASDDSPGAFSFPARQDDLRPEWARTAGLSPHNVSIAANLSLPAEIFLSVIETWRSSAPYDITTGLDPANNGLRTDRGGRSRNSGDGPAYNSLGFYANTRLALPRFMSGPHKRTAINLGIQGDNLLGNRNFSGFGAVVGSPTFGRPLAASPGRSFRIWFSF